MNRKYLVGAALVVALGAPLRAQSVKAGIEAWQHGDYAGAIAVWRPLAEKGDADAQFNLAQAYRLGRGVPTNLAAAQTWFQRAATQGHVDAQTTLGLLLFENGDQAQGLSWLKKAADQGEPRALLVYGTALVNGDSVPQNPVLGYAFVSRAAAQGLPPAKQTLAQLDQVLSLADRKRGVALARKLAAAAPAPGPVPKVASAKAPPAVKPVVTTPPKASAAASPKPAAKAPATKPAETPQAPARAAASGAWRIQLGAFSQRGSAQALYGKLAAKPALAGRHAFYIPAGPVTRLQAGPFESKGAADAACRALGVPCFAVPGK